MNDASRWLTTWVLNAAWQTALVVAAAALAARCMRRAPGRWQHAAWSLALLLCVALPVATVAPLEALAEWATAPALWTPPPLQEPQPETAQPRDTGPLQLPVPVSEGGGALLVLGAGAAAALRSGRLLRGLRAAWRLRRSAVPAERAEFREHRRACEQAFRLRDVPVLQAGTLAGPVTLGVWRPAVVLPDGFAQHPPDTILAALGHEMAHIRRRDYLLHLLGELALLPLAWHPAVPVLRKRLEEARELACDELVAAKILDARSYARSLVAIAAMASPRPHPAAALGVSDGEILRQRVSRLLTGAPADRPARRRLLAGIVMLAGAGVAGTLGSLEAIRPSFRASPASVSGTWQGVDRLERYILRLEPAGAGFQGTIERRLERSPRPDGNHAPPPPPPPPKRRPATGAFIASALAGNELQFEIPGPGGTTRYRLLLRDEQRAFLSARASGDARLLAGLTLARVR